MSAEEVVEEVVDFVKEGTFQLTKKQHYAQLMVVGAFAGATCAVGGYLVAKKQLKTKYEKLVAKEIADAKAFYSLLHKKSDLSTPEKAVSTLMPGSEVEKAADALLTYQGKDDEEPTEINKNVFDERSVDDFDYDEEMKKRSPERPYIISQEEFLQAEPGFDQTTITYYEGDGALADERDQEIPFIDPIIGEGNLQFGHGSGDSRIVYIRNERLSADYEVVKSDGKYAHEVLGLEHGDGGNRGRQQRKATRKFRSEDV